MASFPLYIAMNVITDTGCNFLIWAGSNLFKSFLGPALASLQKVSHFKLHTFIHIKWLNCFVMLLLHYYRPN